MPDHNSPLSFATNGTHEKQESRGAVGLLLLLSAVYGIQYMDQVLIGLFVQPIKTELLLSDTQIGLLTGVAFSLFYVVLGFPLARLADRQNRKRIIVAGTVIFSLATAACGLAGGFVSLFIARICVAFGEAGTMPSAVSMLADRFGPSSRRLAMAIHSSGGFSGTAIGLLALSVFSAQVSWRVIFWSAGGAGLALSILLMALGHEPLRKTRPVVARTFLADMGFLVRNVPYVLITAGLGVGAISTGAAINWIPAFLGRSYNIAQPKIILLLAFSWAVATLGSIIFGLVTNWLNRKGGRGPLLVLSGLVVVFPLLFVLAFNGSSLPLSMTCISAAFFMMSGVRGPAFATIQDIVPSNLQATANATVMFAMYAVGVTLGPLATGIISDALQAYGGAQALRYALSIVVIVGGGGSAALLACAAVSLKRQGAADN